MIVRQCGAFVLQHNAFHATENATQAATNNKTTGSNQQQNNRQQPTTKQHAATNNKTTRSNQQQNNTQNSACSPKHDARDIATAYRGEHYVHACSPDT